MAHGGGHGPGGDPGIGWDAVRLVPGALLLVDDADRVLVASDACAAILGVPDLPGRTVAELVGSSAAELAAAQDAGASLHPTARRADGVEVPLQMRVSRCEVGGRACWWVAGVDIGERLRRQRDADRMRDDLIATVSHELRTPLTSIIGYAELLGDLAGDDLGEEARSMLGVIERNAARELRLVNDLLDLASLAGRLAAGEASGSGERVAIADVVGGCVEATAAEAADRDLVLVTTIDDADRLEVLGEPDRLRQALANVVGNALKFTGPGDRVEVGARREGEQVVITVRDTGIGIEPEELPRIFDRLHRAPEAVRRQIPGAGLGLTIARAIVEGHGGTAEAASEPGVGTVVRLSLPAAPR